MARRPLPEFTVMVVGSADFDDRDKLFEVLDAVPLITTLIHGTTRTPKRWTICGVDPLAETWAQLRGVYTQVYGVNHNYCKLKRRRVRDERMLFEGKPDLVIAFPGAGDIVDKARAAGVEVRVIP